MALRGIDPGAFRLVAQRLNHYTILGPDTVTQGRFISEINDKVVYVHFVKAYGGMEVRLHLFLILA